MRRDNITFGFVLTLYFFRFRKRALERDPFKNSDASDIAPRVHKAERKAAKVKKAKQKAKLIAHAHAPPPPPPPPPPLPITSSTSLIGLPPGTFVPPHIHATLAEIKTKGDAFMTDLEKYGVGDMYKEFQADSRMFLHIWRLDVQAGLRDDGGVDVALQQHNRWSLFCSRGQAIMKELAGIIGLWTPPVSLQDMLRWSVRRIEPFVQFLRLVMMLLDEEILSWRTKGQWVPMSDNSVKAALVKVMMALSCIRYDTEYCAWHRKLMLWAQVLRSSGIGRSSHWGVSCLMACFLATLSISFVACGSGHRRIALQFFLQRSGQSLWKDL